MDIGHEFDRQVRNLLNKRYYKISGLNEKDFVKILSALKTKLKSVTFSPIDYEKGLLPFVIVLNEKHITAEQMMTFVRKNNAKGVVKLNPLTSNDFKTIDSVITPETYAYLLVDIDRGKQSINLPPKEAMTRIINKKRSPLTINEGIAVIMHYPEFLSKNNCFSLLASRHPGDKRVPALWINSKKQANLGWCWDGNPHTWLGSASCKSRIS
ncbi:MAG: DUF5701 family protein [Patescibacteria group bacterium]